MNVFPKLRSDLLVAEHLSRDGSKVVVLKDPVSEKFFRLSSHEYHFLQLFDGNINPEAALEQFRAGGRYYTEQQAKDLLVRASQLGLMLGTHFGTSQIQSHLRERAEGAKRGRILPSVYFLFIPLWNPDSFLTRTLRIFRLLVNKWTLGMVAVAAPGAIYFVIAGQSRLEREFLFFFNLESLLLLWFTIALTKLFHELAHAYTAKAFGLRVPRMGVAFLIFFPCLYCDTTDAWQLADRRQRMLISAAGIFAEGALAIVSAYLWYFSRPGILNSVAFYLMTVSFISTVLFNGNPLMKFDGYFLLIDYLGIPNLQLKSFQFLRHLFTNRVLGIELVTDPAIDRRESALFAVYGVSAAIYRIFLYTGIAAGVYYRFDKTLGLALAVLALGLFIVRPLSRGVRTLYAKKSQIRLQPAGACVFFSIAALFCIALFVPLSSKSVYPCYVASAEVQKLTVPLQTAIAKVHVRQGDTVKKGAVLFELDSSFLNLALLKAESQRNVVWIELQTIRLDSKQRAKAPGKELELYHAGEQVAKIKEELHRAAEGMIAPFDGVVTSLDYRMQPGFRPGEGAIVGELQSMAHRVVRALVPEHDRDKVATGQEATAWFPIERGMVNRGRIASIRPYSERDLRDSPFSSRQGGELATEVRGEQQKDAPLEAQYMCRVTLSDTTDKIMLGMTGILVVPSPPQSIFFRFIDRMYRTFNRESLT